MIPVFRGKKPVSLIEHDKAQIVQLEESHRDKVPRPAGSADDDMGLLLEGVLLARQRASSQEGKNLHRGMGSLEDHLGLFGDLNGEFLGGAEYEDERTF